MYFDQIEKGKLLVAEPYLFDPNFKRSVVLVTGHSDEEGTIGFILNKPLKLNIDELLKGFPEFDAEVFYGGPVSTESVHFIHRAGNILDDSQPIGNGLFWGGDYEKLKFLINSKLIKPGDIRFFVGYAGWDFAQLREEMQRRNWFVAEFDSNYMFKSQSKNLWKEVLQNKGDRYSVIAQMPDTFIFN